MALGKGLTSLIPEKDKQTDRQSPKRTESVFIVEVEHIAPNPEQPRREFNEERLEELAESVREHGVLQPLIVTKVEEEHESGRDVRYEIIAGERRWRAAQRAGLPRVPVIVREPDSRGKLEMALVENIQRDDLNSMEEATAYRRLMDAFGLTQQAVAERVGKSRSTVANVLRLLELPDDIQQAVRDHVITEGHARALLRVDDIARQHKLFQRILKEKLSVRDVEQATKDGDATQKRDTASPTKEDPEIAALQEELAEVLGTDVQVKRTKKGGKIVITFYSDEELTAIKRRFQ